MIFAWDDGKNDSNRQKHGVSFGSALQAFSDPNRVIIEDPDHGNGERRWYCLGKVDGGILTVRFTYRERKIRIFGAGYWRKGKKRYEKENRLHR